MQEKEVEFDLTDSLSGLNAGQLSRVQIKINRYFMDNFTFCGDEVYLLSGTRESSFFSPEARLSTLSSMPFFWSKTIFYIKGTEFRENAIHEHVLNIEQIIREA